jgi:hypothetical protein
MPSLPPHQTWITGHIDIHDVGLGTDGQPVFANTWSNCLATTAEGHSCPRVQGTRRRWTMCSFMALSAAPDAVLCWG